MTDSQIFDTLWRHAMDDQKKKEESEKAEKEF